MLKVRQMLKPNKLQLSDKGKKRKEKGMNDKLEEKGKAYLVQ